MGTDVVADRASFRKSWTLAVSFGLCRSEAVAPISPLNSQEAFPRQKLTKNSFQAQGTGSRHGQLTGQLAKKAPTYPNAHQLGEISGLATENFALEKST